MSQSEGEIDIIMSDETEAPQQTTTNEEETKDAVSAIDLLEKQIDLLEEVAAVTTEEEDSQHALVEEEE